AERYGRIYQQYKQLLMSERSLDFIPVANSKIEVSGCAQVKSVVSALNKAGNNSVFGVIDWDNCNSSDGNIMVMSEGVHYTLENIVLDPILVAATILHETPSGKVDIGLGREISYVQFLKSDAKTLEKASTHIQKLIIG